MSSASAGEQGLDGIRRALEAEAFERALHAADAYVTEAGDEDAAAAHHLGVRAAFALGLQDDALRHGLGQLQRAGRLQDASATARAHNDLAAVYGASGIDDQAIEHLWRALELLEGDGGKALAGPLNNLGNIYLGMERFDEARALYERAARAWHEAGDAAGEALARANVGRSQVLAGRPQRAILSLDAALEAFERLGRSDHVAATHAKLGVAYGALGQPHRAHPAFEHALRLHAEGHGPAFEFDTRLWYGQCLLHDGEAEAAVLQLQRAERLADGDPNRTAASGVLMDQARALEALGRYREGMSVLRRHVEARERTAHDAAKLRARLRLLELEVGGELGDDMGRLQRLALERTNRDLRAQAARLEKLSTTDELTGLRNRRAMNTRLEEEAARAMRYVRPLVLALLDLDGFKAVNDRFSHEVGDQVLKRAAELLEQRLRTSDVAARWGGEEFAVLLPDTELSSAERVLEEIRARLAAYDWSAFGAGLTLTVSIGAAALEEVDELEDLMRLADRRLYGAKQAGRDRTVTEGRFQVPLS